MSSGAAKPIRWFGSPALAATMTLSLHGRQGQTQLIKIDEYITTLIKLVDRFLDL
jgi:hypothetical protein